ncbi:hypothetical protein P168DRAFT_18335 [Aspergillus campestris IBT 28561]|uniref:Uncharacterized protein n=1 Tax=Aspergillus campestris (strain IBT 28561) TaxID=1392248 RepID=A0A2I1DFA8_ASPC2|nr:uncharacterized protein P168DRAFT_18335 [Aspergillus campestris IBT 28561]PKY08541.1 hypothetical protein P168DRAFT_18335 [Aspergillus campestris IBT 28561]
MQSSTSKGTWISIMSPITPPGVVTGGSSPMFITLSKPTSLVARMELDGGVNLQVSTTSPPGVPPFPLSYLTAIYSIYSRWYRGSVFFKLILLYFPLLYPLPSIAYNHVLIENLVILP